AQQQVEQLVYRRQLALMIEAGEILGVAEPAADLRLSEPRLERLVGRRAAQETGKPVVPPPGGLDDRPLGDDAAQHRRLALPHVGTWNEVARTTFVRDAYDALAGAPTRLIAFSDEMDGLRKVPDNVPNQALLTGNLGKPLTQIPDPFGTHESFAHHNNAMLQRFLDRFGFDYEFLSATDCYQTGRFDAVIRRVLLGWDAIMGVMLPTLREDRRKTYSPVLPISPTSGRVLQ